MSDKDNHQAPIPTDSNTVSNAATNATLTERMIALCVLFLAVLFIAAVFYYAIYKPHQQANAEMLSLMSSYQRALALESRRELLEQQLQEWEKLQQNSDTYLLPQATSNLAAAALQERIKLIINLHESDQNRCNIRQQKNLPEVEENSFIRVTVSVVLNCQFMEMQAIIYDLEAEYPALVLDNLHIKNSRTSNRRQRGAQEEVNIRDLQLTIQFDVSGYINQDSSGAGMDAS